MGPPLMVLEVRSWPDVGQEDWRLIDVEDWAEIRRLHKAEGLGIKTIARRLGVARNTVRAALRSDAPPRYERTPRGSVVHFSPQDERPDASKTDTPNGNETVAPS